MYSPASCHTASSSLLSLGILLPPNFKHLLFKKSTSKLVVQLSFRVHSESRHTWKAIHVSWKQTDKSGNFCSRRKYLSLLTKKKKRVCRDSLDVPSGVVDTPEGSVANQRDLDRHGRCACVSFMKFNKAWGKGIPISWGDPKHAYRLGREQTESSMDKKG